MNCDHVEELLPRYLEGDLPHAEREAVAGHLASCARCRESSDAFEALERALEARRGELPRPARIADAVLARLALPRRHRLRIPRWEVPLLAVIIVLAVLLPSLARHESLGGITRRIDTAFAAFVRFLTGMPGWIAGAAGGEWWILLSAYLALTVSFAIAGTLIGGRIVHR